MYLLRADSADDDISEGHYLSVRGGILYAKLNIYFYVRIPVTIQYPELSPQQAKKLLGTELGSSFDTSERLFSYWDNGTVLDLDTWNERGIREMLNRDGQAAALEAVLTLPIRQADWSIMPAKGDKGEAEFVRSVLLQPHHAGGMKTPMQQVIGQATSAQIYRAAFFEKVYSIRPDDGMVIYDKLAYRPATTCQIRRKPDTADFDGFRQQVWLFGSGIANSQRANKTPGYVDIPRARSFVYIHGKHREPLRGLSELELCYWAYQTKMKLLYLWYTFLEGQALPKVAVYAEDPQSAADRADDLAELRSSGIVGWTYSPDQKKAFDVIESSGQGASQFQDALAFLETWQTASVLAGFTGLSSLASLGRGSLALSSDQSAFFLKSRQAITQELATDITNEVVAPLVAYNFGANAAYPVFQFGPLIDDNATALTTMFQTLAVAPGLQIPTGIMDLLTERIATVLDLDVDSVDAIIQDAAKQRSDQVAAQAPEGMPQQSAQQLGALHGATDAATAVVQQALKGAANAPKASIQNQPYSSPNTSSSGSPSGNSA